MTSSSRTVGWGCDAVLFSFRALVSLSNLQLGAVRCDKQVEGVVMVELMLNVRECIILLARLLLFFGGEAVFHAEDRNVKESTRGRAA